MSQGLIRAIYLTAAVVVSFPVVLNVMDFLVYRTTSHDQCAWTPAPKRDDAFLITDVVPGGVSDAAGIKDGDLLLRIDGVPVRKVRDANALINRHRAGDVAIYRIERNGMRVDLPVRIIKQLEFAFLAQVLLGVGFLLVGLAVVLIKPDGGVQRRFGRFSLLSMLYFGCAAIRLIPDQDPAWKVAVLASAFLAARLLAPGFVLFFLHFPVRRKLLDNRWAIAGMYLLAAISILPLVIRLVLHIPISEKLVAYGVIANNAFYVVGLAVFVRSYFRHVERERRTPLRPILHAIVIGTIAYVYGLVLQTSYPLVFYLKPQLLLPIVLIIGVPPAFGFAIVRYRLMDITVVLKRSLIYGIVTASLAAVYILLVLGLGTVVGALAGRTEDRLLTFAAIVIIAFLFDPIKQRVQRLVDRSFYRARSNYQRVLLEFSRELLRLRSLDEILESIAQRIGQTMQVERVAATLCDDRTGCRGFSVNMNADCCSFDVASGGLLAHLQATRAPLSSPLLRDELEALPIRSQDRDLLARAGIALSVPIVLQDTLLGAIFVGPKKSGAAYSQDDMDLLATVAGQAAIAIDNARLHHSEVERQKFAHQLALAKRIQESLLPPRDPEFPGLDLAGVSLPAQSVGGDYYDFITLSPTRMLVVVADVSGKGMPAALYMSKVQGMIQLAAHMHESPRDMLVHVNRRIVDSLERNAFITMILALFDTGTGDVRICRAGHPLPLLGKNGDLTYMNVQGIGMGLERGVLFEDQLTEERIHLTPGEVFVFYSDGLTESRNAAMEEFGEDRLLQTVRHADRSTAGVLRERIISSVKDFQGSAEQHDDLTLVVARVTGVE